MKKSIIFLSLLCVMGCNKNNEDNYSIEHEPKLVEETQALKKEIESSEVESNSSSIQFNDAFEKFTDNELARCGIVTASAYGTLISDLNKNLDLDVLEETKKMLSVIDLNLQIIKYVRDHNHTDQIIEDRLSKIYREKFKNVSGIDLINTELESCYTLGLPLVQPLTESGILKLNNY